MHSRIIINDAVSWSADEDSIASGRMQKSEVVIEIQTFEKVKQHIKQGRMRIELGKPLKRRVSPRPQKSMIS
jgi:hypothetical protein